MTLQDVKITYSTMTLCINSISAHNWNHKTIGKIMGVKRVLYY